MTDTCSVNNCDNDSRARGMCMRHYQLFRASGQMLTTEQLAQVVRAYEDQITAWMVEAGWTPPVGS